MCLEAGNGRWSAASRDLDVDPSAVGLPSINIERVRETVAVSLSTGKTLNSLYKARRLIRSFSGCGPATPPYTIHSDVSTESDEDYTAEETRGHWE
jgi:hypothetical protein